MAEPRDREWTKTGEYEEMYSPEEVYELVTQAPRQVATTTDITDVLGCTPATARRKLRDLQVAGKIENRAPSERITLWYPTEATDGESAAESGGDVATVLAESDPETVLKLLSYQVDGAITVGDTVYENGDKHPLEQTTPS